jgi:hypothetical protein
MTFYSCVRILTQNVERQRVVNFFFRCTAGPLGSVKSFAMMNQEERVLILMHM